MNMMYSKMLMQRRNYLNIDKAVSMLINYNTMLGNIAMFN